MEPSQQAEGKMVCLQEPKGLGAGGGGGWVGGGGEGGARRKSRSPPQWRGTCKSGEGRVGTRPNDSSAELYKYSSAGSTRPLLLVAKESRINRASGSAVESRPDRRFH